MIHQLQNLSINQGQFFDFWYCSMASLDSQTEKIFELCSALRVHKKEIHRIFKYQDPREKTEQGLVKLISHFIYDLVDQEARLEVPYDVFCGVAPVFREYRGFGSLRSFQETVSGFRTMEVDRLITLIPVTISSQGLCFQLISRVRALALNGSWRQDWEIYFPFEDEPLPDEPPEFSEQFRSYLGPTVKRHLRYLRLLRTVIREAQLLERSVEGPTTLAEVQRFLGSPLAILMIRIRESKEPPTSTVYTPPKTVTPGSTFSGRFEVLDEPENPVKEDEISLILAELYESCFSSETCPRPELRSVNASADQVPSLSLDQRSSVLSSEDPVYFPGAPNFGFNGSQEFLVC